MHWESREPKIGEIIRTPIGEFYHYGIFKSYNEVIQFGKNPKLISIDNKPICVCITSMPDFLCGNVLQVLNHLNNDLYNPEKTLQNALSRLGEKGYHLIHNNCEHFVFECAFQKKHSSQIENLRIQFRNMYSADVYIASIPSRETGNVSSFERQQLIDKTTNLSLRRQRYFVWKLLEYALMQSFGLKISDISFNVDENGKWHCDDCYFSLSHCNDAVAVAVSKKPIGVDIENTKHNFPSGFAEKVLTENELAIYNTKNNEEKNHFLMECWCAKESIFKADNNKTFHPSKIEHDNNTKIGVVEINANNFCYAVCCDDSDKIRIFNNIEL